MMGFDPVSYAMGAKSGGGGGSGGGVLVVHADEQTMTLDKTWQEIHDADIAVVTIENDSIATKMWYDVLSVSAPSPGVTKYSVSMITYNQGTSTVVSFKTDSADGYPVVDMGG